MISFFFYSSASLDPATLSGKLWGTGVFQITKEKEKFLWWKRTRFGTKKKKVEKNRKRSVLVCYIFLAISECWSWLIPLKAPTITANIHSKPTAAASQTELVFCAVYICWSLKGGVAFSFFFPSVSCAVIVAVYRCHYYHTQVIYHFVNTIS